MIRVFGKGKQKSAPPEPAEAVRGVDDRADSVQGKIASLETELRKCKDQLNKMREGPAKDNVKQKAVRVLKQKRAYEAQLEGLRNQSFAMEQAEAATQAARDTRATVAAMRRGVRAMRRELGAVHVDHIERLQDQVADLLEHQEEVQAAVARSYRVPEVDDDELQAELEALGEELALDDDHSYLDRVHTTGVPLPGVPGVPGEHGPSASGGNTPGVPRGSDPSASRDDHALVDEFGLPKLPSSRLLETERTPKY